MAQANNRDERQGQANSALVDRLARTPVVRARMRVGLLGGSFDPPHEGHVHISLEAIKRLQLDQLWWLVSPGNPLKERGPWPLEQRLQQSLEFTDHPKLKLTAVEARLGSPFTAQTLKYLTRRFPATRFVWLMGADNMASVHTWRDWQQLFATVPVAVLDRPGENAAVSSTVAAQLFRRNRIKERAAGALAGKKAPAWSTLTIPLNFESSTRIRKKHQA